DQDVIAVAAVRRKLDSAGGQAGGLHYVVAGQGVDDQPIVGRLGAADVHHGGQTGDGDTGRVAGYRNHVGVVGAVDDDGVGRPVAGVAAGSARQVDIDLGHGGAGQVVDGDGVGAAEGVEVDGLAVGEVHRPAGHVAEEAPPRAVGRDVDVLVGVRAVEQHGVEAVLTLDGVVTVTGVPHEGVVAGPQEGHVIAAAADHQVVTLAADQQV